MCFGGSDDSSSRKMIQMQEEEAELARQAEEDRQARINQGLASIRGAFEGTKPTKAVTKQYDWSTFAKPKDKDEPQIEGLPEGYSYAQQKTKTKNPKSSQGGGGTDALALMGQGRTGDSGAYAQYNIGDNSNEAGSGGDSYTTTREDTIVGPDGKIYRKGEALPYEVQEEYGEAEGGFDKGFYDKFKQGMLSYFQPEVASQYKDAREELAYRLARAGQLRSSTSAQETADLYRQNLTRTGEVASKADAAAADLKTRVGNERAKAEAQLYATENPEVAASQALSAVQNISAEPPDLTPLGALFDIASIGTAGGIQGYKNAEFAKNKSWLPSSDRSRVVS